MNSPRATFCVLLGTLALLAALAPPPAAAQPVATAPVFQVNTYTNGDQIWPVVAGNGSGRFVAVWNSARFVDGPTQDGDGSGVFAQLFDASGAQIGTEIQVNQTTAGNQIDPAVAMDEDGGFVVVWSSDVPSGGPVIFGRRFDATGAPLGDELAVRDPSLPNSGYNPSIALDGEGRFVVAWDQGEIFARRFDAAGNPLGAPFKVSVEGERIFDSSPALVMNPAGDFSVIYQTLGPGSGGEGALLFRRFTADGGPVGDSARLDVPPRFRPFDPQGAPRPDGSAVVTWYASGVVSGRLLGPAGIPQGPAFQVSARTGSFEHPHVAADGSGGFLIAWTEYGERFEGLGLFGQRFTASGARQGVEFRLDTGPAEASSGAVATVRPNGDFVAVWTAGRRTGDGPDGSGTAILGRIFRIPPLGADACVASGGHLACDVLRDGGDAELASDLAAQPGDVPLAGNLDGDVRDDFCLYRDGRFLCDTAHDGASPEVAIAFGGAGDIPLLGDLNGDGKDDACVRRRRRFLCDTAHNGATAEMQILFGRPADVPLLGDVDGDGDDDPCVYRAGRFSCDTVHNGRGAEVVVSFGPVNGWPLLGDLDNDGDDDFLSRPVTAFSAIPRMMGVRPKSKSRSRARRGRSPSSATWTASRGLFR